MACFKTRFSCFSYDKFITNFPWHRASSHKKHFSFSQFYVRVKQQQHSSISTVARDSKWMRWLIITKKIWAAEVICLRNFLLSSSLQISMSSSRRAWGWCWAVFIIINCFLLSFLLKSHYCSSLNSFIFILWTTTSVRVRLMNFWLSMCIEFFETYEKLTFILFYCLFDILLISLLEHTCQAMIIRESSWA